MKLPYSKTIIDEAIALRKFNEAQEMCDENIEALDAEIKRHGELINEAQRMKFYAA